jgi:cyanophycinase-like exopeptidase
LVEQPGLIVLFGSGETSASGRRVFDWLFRRLPSPIQAAILETPAGFELNSAQVARRVADFLRHRLQNHHPQVTVVPARKRGTPFSPDDPEIVAPLLGADAVFLGPGSPTYAVRQLQDSLAWHTLVARHRLGAAVVLASAGAIASSAYALPVYEIYKVGQDLHWCDGLDFFGAYGLSLVFVSHWNNAEGGAELDTSRCYMGQARFESLRGMLPPDVTVVGIDEHTALAIDLAAETCHVLGKGGVTLLRGGDEQRFESGVTFSIDELGRFSVPEPGAGLPPEVWDRAVAAHTEIQPKARQEPSPEVLALVREREAARAQCDWATADALRERIATLGWHVLDTSQGPQLEPEEEVSG